MVLAAQSRSTEELILPCAQLADLEQDVSSAGAARGAQRGWVHLPVDPSPWECHAQAARVSWHCIACSCMAPRTHPLPPSSAAPAGAAGSLQRHLSALDGEGVAELM